MEVVEGRTMGLFGRFSQSKKDPKAAEDYEIAIDRQQGLMRFAHKSAGGVLSYQVLEPDEAYALAQKILRGYDKLEGISQ